MIHETIKPETKLEELIISDPEFIAGAMYGKPRPGHPEGEVINHIGHVLKNIDKYSSGEERQILRLIGIIHDTFKYKVDRSKSKDGENHHAMIARRFAERYIPTPLVLDIIELHDEAYNSWCKGDRDGKWDKAEFRVKKLIERLGSAVDLYLTFYRCDNETGDKDSENFTWFENLVSNTQST